MKLKFTARKPKPRPAVAEPLQTSPVPECAKQAADQGEGAKQADKPRELGGPSGPEPTRYGDWERKGICVDF